MDLRGREAHLRNGTAGKQAKEALRESETRLRLAVETAELGLYERDLLSNEVQLNPTCRQILGIGQTAPPPDIAYRSVHPEDQKRVYAAVGRAFDPVAREICAAEFRILRPDGTIRWVAGRGRVIFDDTVTPPRAAKFIGVLDDITTRKLAEQALIEAKESLSLANVDLESQVNERTARLRDAVLELERLSYALVHDLRAPLRAIRSFGGIIAQDVESKLSPQSRDLLEKMRTAAGRMDRLVVDVLNYANVVRGELPLGPVNVGELARHVVETYPDLRPPKVEVKIHSMIPAVLANEAALAQCLGELMQNAARFCKPDRMCHIEVRATRAEKGWVRVLVADDGIGIAPEFHDRIFEMFQRLSAATEGTGVGLAIVKKAIEQMGGRVGVESQPGDGSRFWFELKAWC